MNKLNVIKDKFKENNIELSDIQAEQFLQYYELLVEKNKVMNLTAIVEFDDVLIKHFIDSVLITKVVDMDKVNNIIDIGTGAGFPGLPLKIIYPDKNVVLMDSLNKRIKFLDEVCEKIELTNIETIHSRAEELARKDAYREKFDLVVSRAVANLSTLSEYCLPFTKVGGMFVSYKADNVEEEVSNSSNAIKILGAKLNEVKYIKLDEQTKRSFIIIDKIKNTSKKYPRKAGTPGNSPL